MTLKRPRRKRPRTTPAPPAPPDRPVGGSAGTGDDRLTYRELRNTPGRVWERLAGGGPLTLVADGEAKAIVIPIQGGNPAEELEAYTRARGLMALWKLQADSRAKGTDTMTLEQINAEIRATRRARRTREEGRLPGRSPGR